MVKLILGGKIVIKLIFLVRKFQNKQSVDKLFIIKLENIIHFIMANCGSGGGGFVQTSFLGSIGNLHWF